jgi:hypothetical protein
VRRGGISNVDRNGNGFSTRISDFARQLATKLTADFPIMRAMFARPPHFDRIRSHPSPGLLLSVEMLDDVAG